MRAYDLRVRTASVSRIPPQGRRHSLAASIVARPRRLERQERLDSGRRNLLFCCKVARKAPRKIPHPREQSATERVLAERSAQRLTDRRTPRERGKGERSLARASNYSRAAGFRHSPARS